MGLAYAFLLVTWCFTSVSCAPVPHRKKYTIHEISLSKKPDRKHMGSDSPIHFIQPFVALFPSKQKLLPPQPPSPPELNPSSPIVKLPLMIFSNAKPLGILDGISSAHHGFARKPLKDIGFQPYAVANVIRLPLKFVSNGKPIRVYFKNPSYNFVGRWSSVARS